MEYGKLGKTESKKSCEDDCVDSTGSKLSFAKCKSCTNCAYKLFPTLFLPRWNCYMKDDAEARQQNSVHRRLRSHPSIEAVDMGRM